MTSMEVSEMELQKDIQKLWEKPQTNIFMTGVANLLKKYSLQDIVLESAATMASRVTSKKYSSSMNYALLGMENAWQLTQFFYTQSRYLPVIQMLWYGVCEARVQSVDIKQLIGTPPSEDELNLETFKEAYSKGQFEKAFKVLVFLLRNNDRDRQSVLNYLVSSTLSDELNTGHKIIYLVKTWQFCENLKWKNYHLFWFPLMHYLMKAPPQVETYPLVESFYKDNASNLLKATSNTKNTLSKPFYEAVKNSLYNDEKSASLEKISSWLREGYSLTVLFELLKCSACELNPMLHALPYASSLSDVREMLNPEDQVKALLMAALFIKKMAILSKPIEVPAVEPLKTIDEKNIPQFFLEHAIVKGQVTRALGALEELIQTQRIDKTKLELLAFLASKNTYHVFHGHDIEFAYACLKSYSNAGHELKDIYLRSLVKFLASQTKELTICNALSNTQKIKLGYFSTEGNFNF